MRGHGPHGGGHLGDHVVGGGEDQHVDAAGGRAEVVVAAQEAGEGPAARRERGGEGRAGPAGPDNAEVRHLTSFGVPAPLGCRSPTDDPDTYGYRLPTRTTSPPEAATWDDVTRSGARSASGARTKRRSHSRGWGTVRSSVVDRLALHVEHVGVERARAPALQAHPARRRLELLAALEEAAGRVGGGQLDHQVEVGALAGGPAHRLGLVEGRDGDHVAAPAQPGHGAAQVGPAVPEIGAQADEGPAHRRRHQRLRRTRTPVEPTSSGSGGCSLRTVTSTASIRGSTMSRAVASRPARASSSR